MNRSRASRIDLGYGLAHCLRSWSVGDAARPTKTLYPGELVWSYVEAFGYHRAGACDARRASGGAFLGYGYILPRFASAALRFVNRVGRTPSRALRFGTHAAYGLPMWRDLQAGAAPEPQRARCRDLRAVKGALGVGAALSFAIVCLPATPASACPSCAAGQRARSRVWNDEFVFHLAAAVFPFMAVGAMGAAAERIGRSGRSERGDRT